MSTKGQVILPKAVRESRRWAPGTELVVEETDRGVLLRPVHSIAATRMDDVFGSVKVARKLAVEDMDEALITEMRARADD